MKIMFFYNSKSGTIKDSPQILDNVIEKIKSKLNENDQLEIFDVIKNDEYEVMQEKQFEGDIKIFIAGGDGTISKVINKVVDFGLPVGILPLGTFNNFSKSIKLPQDADAAVDELFAGKIIEIDLGKVNDKIFINNSSVGAYTKIVSIREESQVNFNLNKPAAMFLSLVKTTFLFPLIKVSLMSDNIQKKVKTPAVMISNNMYKFGLDTIGERESLTEGLLYLHVIKCKTRLCVMKVFLKGLFNMLDEEKDFELISSTEVELKVHKKEIDVSADGEIYKMKPPLKYQTLPKKLKIIVPNYYE